METAQKCQPLSLETEITARFVNPNDDSSPAYQASIDAMNKHAEEIAERLQVTVRLLVVEMMDIKRQQFTQSKEQADARPE